MHLLIGHDAPVRAGSVIAVVDLDGRVTTPDTADFLRKAEREKITRLAGDNLPKSAVITAPQRKRARHSRMKLPKGKSEVIFSTLSAAVILRRSARKRGGM